MKTNLKFHDADNNLAEIDIKIEDSNITNSEGKIIRTYKRFSMSGMYNGSAGQCLGDIKPKNKYQKDLIEMWKQYHLNNINAGTKLQRKILEGFKGDYTESSEYLKEHDHSGNELSMYDYKRFIKSYNEYKLLTKGFNLIKEYIMDDQNSISLFNNNVKYISIKQEYLKVDKYIKDLFIKELENNLSKNYFIKRQGYEIQLHRDGSMYGKINDKFTQKLLDKITVKREEDIYLSGYIVKEEIDGKEITYTYGHGLIKDPLPKQIEDRINQLVTNIEAIEEEEYHTSITEQTYKNNSVIQNTILEVSEKLDTSEAKILAICIECEVRLESLLEDTIKCSGNRFTVEGNELLVCTDEEADDEYLEYVTNLIDDIGFSGLNGVSGPSCELVDGEIIVTESVTFGSGERGNSLASWDGEERYETVLNEIIYMYKI